VLQLRRPCYNDHHLKLPHSVSDSKSAFYVLIAEYPATLAVLRIYLILATSSEQGTGDEHVLQVNEANESVEWLRGSCLHYQYMSRSKNVRFL